MNSIRHRPLRAVCALFAATALLGSAIAFAAKADHANPALARFQVERAACLMGQTSEDQATCLREAGAAWAQARRGELDDGAASYKRNALERCAPLPDEDRIACRARLLGMGTTSGSVAGGGILRELVIREIVWPDNAAATPASAP